MQLIDLISSNPLLLRYKAELLSYNCFDDLYNSLKTKLVTSFNSISHESSRQALKVDIENFDTFFIRLMGKLNNELYQLICRNTNQQHERLSIAGKQHLEQLLRIELPNILQLYNPDPRIQSLIQFESYFLTLHGLVNVINIDLTSSEYLQRIPDVKEHLEDHLPYLYKQLNPYYSSINSFLVLYRERKQLKDYSLSNYVHDYNEIMELYLKRLLKSCTTRQSKFKTSTEPSSYDSRSTRSSTEHTQTRLPLVPCRRLVAVGITDTLNNSPVILPRIMR